MGQFQKLCDLSALPPGKSVCVAAGTKSIALFNVGGKCFAIDDACTHVGGNLSEGEVEGTVVTCPWHGARFDLESGAVLGPPATEPVKSYPVEIRGQDVLVDLA